jgi:hypothetical protein
VVITKGKRRGHKIGVTNHIQASLQKGGCDDAKEDI